MRGHWPGRRVEAVRGLGDASVEEVRVALERDERVGVPRERLDKLHVRAGGGEARDARVPKIVKAVPVAVDAGPSVGSSRPRTSQSIDCSYGLAKRRCPQTRLWYSPATAITASASSTHPVSYTHMTLPTTPYV